MNRPFLYAMLFALFLIPLVGAAQIQCSVESKVVGSPTSTCPAGKHAIVDFYEYTNSHISQLNTNGANLTLCCTFVNNTAFFTQSSCPSDYDMPLLRAEEQTNSHVALPNVTGWGNYNLCLNNSPDYIMVNNSQISPGYGLALKLNTHNNSHVQANNFTEYLNELWIANVPNAPIITVKAVRNDSFNITWTDTSAIEKHFVAYANRTPNPLNIVVLNDSTNEGGTGGRFTNKTSGPDSRDGSEFCTTFCPNQSYFIRARFNDSDGDFGPWSTEIKKWTLASPPNLTNRTIIEGSSVSYNISWDMSDGNPSDTIYKIEWSNTPRDQNSWKNLCETNASNGQPAPSQRYCMHSNVDQGLQYCYRGYAQNGDGLWNFRRLNFDAEQEPAFTTCSEAPSIITGGVTTWLDPGTRTSATSEIVKTYLFIENSGNAPDNYSITYSYNSSRIELTKRPQFGFVRSATPEGTGIDRFEIEMQVLNVKEPTDLVVTVRSANNQSAVGSATFTLQPTKIIGVPGPGWKEVAMIVLLSAAAILLL